LIACTGPVAPAFIRTRQVDSSVLPWLGPANAVIVALGVLVVRSSVGPKIRMAPLV
jgi:hypothetical protein